MARGAVGHRNAVAFERGLQAFVHEARKLGAMRPPGAGARAASAAGARYGLRVMPWYAGRSLIEVRRDLVGPLKRSIAAGPARQPAGGLAGLFTASRRTRWTAPGADSAAGRRPRCPDGAAAAHRALAGDSAQAAIDHGFARSNRPRRRRQRGKGVTDFYALAQVARYCITGMMPPLTGRRPSSPWP